MKRNGQERGKWVHCRQCNFRIRKAWQMAQHVKFQHPKVKPMAMPEAPAAHQIAHASLPVYQAGYTKGYRDALKLGDRRMK